MSQTPDTVKEERGPSSGPQGGGPKEKSELTLQQVLIPIWKERKRIVLISFAVGLLTLGVNFLLPVYYKSTATLLPETQKDKLSALGQFADIASLAGVNVPGSEIARLYPTIVSSETVLRNVIEKKYKTKAFSDSVNLIQYFELDEKTPEENMSKALKKLRVLMTAAFDNKTSVVTLSMEMEEPQLAADALNGLVGFLDEFMRFKRVNNASEQVKWIDVRLNEIVRELRLAEEALKTFRERNRQVGSSPELLMQQERLLREIQVKSAVFVELKKQHELAKLEEIKNSTIVNVLDPARAPVKKESPKRAINSAIMFLVAFVSASGYFVGRKTHAERLYQFLRMFRGV